MSRKPCPRMDKAGCPVAERSIGCYSDRDHIVPQRYKTLGWLVSKYIYTPENIEQKCRWEHEQKTTTESIELVPTAEYMVGAVRSAYDSGYLTLNKRDQEKLVMIEQAVQESEVA